MNIQKLQATLEKPSKAIIASASYEVYQRQVNEIDFNGLRMAKANAKTQANNKKMPCWGEPALSVEDDTATIKVRGLLAPKIGVDIVSWGLTGYDVIAYYLDEAENNSKVKNIVLDMDSGGGYVKGLAELLEKIANLTKPISTFVSGDCYSACYWLACSTEKITANKDSGIGSIGVILVHTEYSEKLKKDGININVFKSGFWKDAFGSHKKLSEKERKRLQNGVDETAKQFFEYVAKHRKTTAKAIEKLDADTFYAEQALEINLIDEVFNAKSNAKTNSEKSKSQTQTKTETKTLGENMPITEEQLAKAVAEARAEERAKVTAEAERTKQVYALETTEEVKALLASDEFANVEISALEKLTKTMPKGFNQVMDEEGGAGVQANPSDFVQKTDDEIEQAEAEKSAEQLAKLGSII